MRSIGNNALQDIVEFNGDYYLVSSYFAMTFVRGYFTYVQHCFANGNLISTYHVCEVEHERTFDAVEKGHKDVCANLGKYIDEYQAKQEEEKRKKEEQRRKTRERIYQVFNEPIASANSDLRSQLDELYNTLVVGNWRIETNDEPEDLFDDFDEFVF